MEDNLLMQPRARWERSRSKNRRVMMMHFFKLMLRLPNIAAGEELYFIAAGIVARAMMKKATIKSLCYAAPFPNKKKLMALVCESLRYYVVLSDMFTFSKSLSAIQTVSCASSVVCIILQTPGSILQYIAAYCSILQHFASHCSILQHIAAYCITLQHIVVYYSKWEHLAA